MDTRNNYSIARNRYATKTIIFIFFLNRTVDETGYFEQLFNFYYPVVTTRINTSVTFLHILISDGHNRIVLIIEYRLKISLELLIIVISLEILIMEK